MQPDADKPSDASNSKEYRERLLQKLNCLIAVLQVAIAKVRRNLDTPSADLDRLGRIRANLERTLGICQKAKASLERWSQLPAQLSADLSTVIGLPTDASALEALGSTEGEAAAPNELAEPRERMKELPRPAPERRARRAQMNYRHYVEFSSLDEFKRFRERPAITPEECSDVNFEDLCRKLQSS
ncbi:MAG: hypothetical protein JNM84_27360 [Planctomycetes bacterium]|nr:hypothetical protein [Planctomycetota bacterium]